MSLLLLLALRLAHAAASDEARVGSARIYGSARASVAVPTGMTGLAQSYSAEVGAMFRDGNQFGLRFAVVPDPPDVYGKNTPDIAIGPVLGWAYNVRIARQFDLYPTVALGAVFGQAPVSKENKVLPYLQTGVGLRGRFALENGAEIAVGPEIGFVPTLLAPYAGVTVGLIGAKPSPQPLE